MTKIEQFNILKKESENRHIRIYYYNRNNNEIQIGDIVTNERWIHRNVGEFKKSTINDYIFCYDACLKKLINVHFNDLIWDEINRFYDDIPEWDIQSVKRIEDKVRFIGNSSLFGFKDPIYSSNKDKQPIKISKRKNPARPKFSISFYKLKCDNKFLFQDYINGEYYEGIIPFDYIDKHKELCWSKKGNPVCWLIHEKDIKYYFDNLGTLY